MLQEQGKVKIDIQIIPVIDFDTKINTFSREVISRM